jgi:hypothetical protein
MECAAKVSKDSLFRAKTTGGTGSLGPLQDSPTSGLRNVVLHLYREAAATKAGAQFVAAVRRAWIEYFGWTNQEAEKIGNRILGMEDEDFLDFLEILVDEGSTPRDLATRYREWQERAIPDADARFNEIFERHLFGYRFESGEIHKIGSPALDEEVVGPALLALKRPGYEQAERSFQEALRHQRSGGDENDDALTAANAAVEAAMKAAGFKGANLGAARQGLQEVGVRTCRATRSPRGFGHVARKCAAPTVIPMARRPVRSPGRSPWLTWQSTGLAPSSCTWPNPCQPGTEFRWLEPER